MLFRLTCFALLSLFVMGPVHAQKVNGVDPRVIEEYYELSKPYVYATKIAKLCRSIKLKRGAKMSFEKWTQALLRKHGMSEGRLQKEVSLLPKKQKQEDASAFVKDNKIVPTDNSTYCVAGKKLITNGSEIGNYLAER